MIRTIAKPLTAVSNRQAVTPRLDPGLSDRQHVATKEVRKYQVSHDVPGHRCTGHQFVAGHHGQFRVSEVSKIQQHEADHKERKRQRQRAADTHRSDPENCAERSPGDQKPSNVGFAGNVDIEVIANENQGQ